MDYIKPNDESKFANNWFTEGKYASLLFLGSKSEIEQVASIYLFAAFFFFFFFPPLSCFFPRRVTASTELFNDFQKALDKLHYINNLTFSCT